MDLHNKNCKCMAQPVEDPIVEMQKRIEELQEENTSCKTKLIALRKTLETDGTMSVQIQLERFKNKIYRHIIQKNTSIRMEDVLVEKEDGIHVYNIKDGNIPVFVHDHIKDEKGLIIHQEIVESKKKSIKKSISKIIRKKTTPKKVSIRKPPKIIEHVLEEPPKQRKQNYRSIKSCLEISKELSDEDISVKVNLADADIQEKLEEFGDLNATQISFTTCFGILKTSRIYTKILNDLKNLRTSVFGCMSLSEYHDLIMDHIRIIEEIFQDKKYTAKKIAGIICKGLSPLESRLVAYNNYTNAHISVDEVLKLGTVLDLCTQPHKEYVPFDIHRIYELFFNYGTVLFPIKKNLERYLVNRYGFQTMVYLPLPKNTEEDTYSFYVLEKVNKPKRYWKMDCRLEDFSVNLITNVLPYMISMFRKLYRDVFGDNDFRSDFNNRCQLTECDCEQLLQNIILMGQPKEFCNMVMKLIKKNATYSHTENDKFNLYGDDALQRKRFQDKEEVDLIDILKQLFDGITSEEAVDFYRSRLI
jgi:hypothetical protein